MPTSNILLNVGHWVVKDRDRDFVEALFQKPTFIPGKEKCSKKTKSLSFSTEESKSSPYSKKVEKKNL